VVPSAQANQRADGQQRGHVCQHDRDGNRTGRAFRILLRAGQARPTVGRYPAKWRKSHMCRYVWTICRSNRWTPINAMHAEKSKARKEHQHEQGSRPPAEGSSVDRDRQWGE